VIGKKNNVGVLKLLEIYLAELRAADINTTNRLLRLPVKRRKRPAASEPQLAQPLVRRYTVPISVPRHLMGYDDIFKEIDLAFESSTHAVAAAALWGLPGVGKTTFAAAYADKHKGDYEVIWWIRAHENSAIHGDLVSLGLEIGWVSTGTQEERVLSEVMERLRSAGDRILLIYDSATDVRSVKPYLPRGGKLKPLR
jgi:hypothetical protein